MRYVYIALLLTGIAWAAACAQSSPKNATVVGTPGLTDPKNVEYRYERSKLIFHVWRVEHGNGDVYDYTVNEFTLDDGTRCLIPPAGGMECDWDHPQGK